jgi:glycosyltransferase involved in cell wall biosynthesis
MLQRWQHFYPDAEFIIEADDGIDPFNKSLAVNNCAAKATGDIYVVLDADTWVHPSFMEKAIEVVTTGRGLWTRPAHHIRLNRGFSEKLMAMPPQIEELPPFSATRDSESHGHVVGFLWVISAKAWWKTAWYDDAGNPRGMDERIRGWGGEDSAFAMAARAMIGPPRRIGGTVICLWHARPRDGKNRIWVNQDRSKQQDKVRIVGDYRRAMHRVAKMKEVLRQP